MKHIIVFVVCLLSLIFSQSSVAALDRNTSARCLVWSPDGANVSFTTAAGMTIASATGEVKEYLRDGYQPKWSPSGKEIAFSVYPSGTRKSDIVIYNTVDKSTRYLTKAIDGYSFPDNDTTGAGWGQYYTFPDWSPDGKSILFAFSFMSTDALLIQSTDKGKTGKVMIARDIYQASWSPDGKTIAATHITSALEHQLVLMNPRGANRKVILKDKESTLKFPTWSPDGKQIAFVRFNRKPTTYVVNADGSNERLVTDGDCPSWSPDGKTLAVTREVSDREYSVFFVNPDGSNERLFTYQSN